MLSKKPLSFEGVHHLLKTLFAEGLHAKRVLSLAGATVGVIASALLAVAMIGQGLALARGLLSKHAIKMIEHQREGVAKAKAAGKYVGHQPKSSSNWRMQGWHASMSRRKSGSALRRFIGLALVGFQGVDMKGSGWWF